MRIQRFLHINSSSGAIQGLLMSSQHQTTTAMDFYNPERTSFFLIGLTKWWRMPVDEKGETILVVSVNESDAQLWVVAYSLLP